MAFKVFAFEVEPLVDVGVAVGVVVVCALVVMGKATMKATAIAVSAAMTNLFFLVKVCMFCFTSSFS